MYIPLLPSGEDLALEYASQAHVACGKVSIPNNLDTFTFNGLTCISGPFTNVEKAQDYLNAGCAQVLIPFAFASFFHDVFPAHRIVVECANETELEELISQHFFCHFQVSNLNLAEFIATHKKFGIGGSIVLLDENKCVGVEEIGRLHRAYKDRPIHVCQAFSSIEFVASAFLSCITPSDRPDQLIPTVVCDEQRVCLGMVYSNAESVQRAIQTQRGVYWSRSRKQLWIKGETSGCVQQLVSIDLDCDGDALQFCVKQTGTGFCHLNTQSCFGPNVGLSHLVSTLQDRMENAPKGSYTARLFADGQLLKDKLVEEAAELSEAVLGAKQHTDTVEHVAEETADVLYFAFTAMLAGGANLSQVEQVLNKRALAVKRRPGNAKKERQAEFQHLFEGKKKQKTDEEA